jgi:hypothetical protein
MFWEAEPDSFDDFIHCPSSPELLVWTTSLRLAQENLEWTVSSGQFSGLASFKKSDIFFIKYFYDFFLLVVQD